MSSSRLTAGGHCREVEVACKGSAQRGTVPNVSPSGDAVCGATKLRYLSVNQSSWYLESCPEMGGSSNLSGTALAAIGTPRCTFYVPGAAKKESLVTWVCANRWKTRV